MDDTILIDLVDEVRADYQIPPYTPDDTIVRAVKESAARLSGLVEAAINWYEDHTARELLKARTYYSLSHVLDEFESRGRDRQAVGVLRLVVESDVPAAEEAAKRIERISAKGRFL